ncbi:hypothetical protein COU37_00375 [Candidatus Micrarchaeota archaeon CG10_big_fil_rev_8_21_14_0_10_45_29]|nr:MAG: hypothetical protein COU37_00375 [Candidatus Micrarchaeota archaeon CG10_big_fil_rev_8_21_14_0_10_45_29]
MNNIFKVFARWKPQTKNGVAKEFSGNGNGQDACIVRICPKDMLSQLAQTLNAGDANNVLQYYSKIMGEKDILPSIKLQTETTVGRWVVKKVDECINNRRPESEMEQYIVIARSLNNTEFFFEAQKKILGNARASVSQETQ